MKAAPSVIDLRSDTVTRPTPAMRRAIAEAEVGDDVLGDDPTVIRLQQRVAEIMGKPAAVFVPSGSMANQIAIRAHVEPGDEIIAHEDSHIINYETGAPAALAGAMIRTARGPRGLFDADQVESLYRPLSDHFPRTRLVVIENTQNRGGGAVWPLEQSERVTHRARALGLICHLDGARLWNASAATGIEPAEYAKYFDTVSCVRRGRGAGRHQRGPALHPRDQLAVGLRHRDERVGVELEIPVLLRHACCGADDLLRGVDRIHPGLRCAVGGHVQPF
ncbi:threonine aldolase family protein [Leptolyngbya sp. 15MV]|nr:threonine aldolase family protein [Leptolyngbya sp. 15MV]